MKIGIMTFHWGTNYGAVLQSYALSEYLKQRGHTVEVIDYYPKKYNKTVLRAFLTKKITSIPQRLKDVTKNRFFNRFRSEHLALTGRYTSFRQLEGCGKDFDCFICGSDQIWNRSFIKYAEYPEENYAYFLDFVENKKMRISYAASFGDVIFPEMYMKKIKPVLENYSAISVREKSGIDILKKAGLNGVHMVPDPVFLPDVDIYKKFVMPANSGEFAFAYMLHGKERDADEVTDLLKQRKLRVFKNDNKSVEGWISNIYNSQLVVTNSFHGIAFSILFRKKFVAFTISGSGMNDRIYTVLNELGLEGRIYNGDPLIIDEEINWAEVEKRLTAYREKGYSFLNGLI